MSFNNNMRRVRLSFDHTQKVTKCWMMVDFNTCKFVSDLENAITERFFPEEETGGHIKLRLYVDDFLLPPQEVIHVVHENDMIRVEVTQSDQRADRQDKHSTRTNGFHFQERQTVHSSEETDTKKKKKKEKKNKKTVDSDTSDTSVAKSMHPTNHCMDSKSPRKHKKRKVMENEVEESKCRSNEKEEAKVSSKSHQEKKRKKNQSFQPDDDVADSSSSKQKGHRKVANKEDRNRDSTSTKKVVAAKSQGIPIRQESSKSLQQSQTKTKKNNNTKQKHSVDKSGLSVSSLTKQDISNIIDDHQKTKAPAKSVGQRLLEISQASTDSLNSKPKLKRKTGMIKGHIRFGSSDDESSSSDSDSSSGLSLSSAALADGYKSGGKVPASSKTQIDAGGDRPVLKAKSVANHPLESNGAGNAPNAIHANGHQACNLAADVTGATENGFQDGVDGSRAQGSWRGNGLKEPKIWTLSKKSQLNTQLSNTSIVIQNPKDAVTNGKDATATTDRTASSNDEPVKEIAEKPKDYSTYPSLVGPPRVGDKIAYKILEMSNIYCPEVSDYKEAEVISYSPENKTIDVKLKSVLNPVKRRGRFELHYENEEESEELGQPSDVMTLELSTLIDPRLL